MEYIILAIFICLFLYYQGHYNGYNKGYLNRHKEIRKAEKNNPTEFDVVYHDRKDGGIDIEIKEKDIYSAIFDLIIKENRTQSEECNGCDFNYEDKCICPIDEMFNLCCYKKGIWKYKGMNNV